MEGDAAADPAQVQALLDVVFGYMPARVVHVAAELGIADELGDGPRTSEELATATGMDADGLHRLLRALASVGIVEELAGRSFRLTDRGALLRTDHPSSVRDLARYFGRDTIWGLWAQLQERVRTGQSLLQSRGFPNPYAVQEGDADFSAVFNGAMADASRLTVPAVVAAYDFSRFASVVDIGGGTGTLLAAILQAHPALQGVLFDLASGVREAPERLEAAGVAERCRIVVGDFFTAVPEGGDAYVMKYVTHNWPDDQATLILQNCRRAMPPGGRLVVIERLLPKTIDPRPDPLSATIVGDLSQLVQTGGRERSEAELDGLFAAAGFHLDRVLPLGPPFNLSLIEGVPE